MVILQAMKMIDLDMLAMIVIGVLMSISTVYLYCFIGSLTTDHFFRYGDISYESQWYKPIDLQKSVQLIIADAQRPIIFHGFHIIELNIPGFTMVHLLRYELIVT